jgi:hypothetical protein
LTREALEQRILEVEREILAIKTHEVGVVCGERGEEFRKVGRRAEVEFTKAERDQLKDRVFTHNHPGGNSFSDAGWLLAVASDMAQMRAVGSDDTGGRWLYTLTRPEAGWQIQVDALGQVLSIVDLEVRREFLQAIVSRRMTPEESTRLHWHEVATRVARIAGIPYARKAVTK